MRGNIYFLLFLIICIIPSTVFARYFDPRTNTWVSVDPVIQKYLPTGNKAKDKNLLGMGGVYNSGNLGAYSYSHNNPLIYVDPNGKYAVYHGQSVGGNMYYAFVPNAGKTALFSKTAMGVLGFFLPGTKMVQYGAQEATKNFMSTGGYRKVHDSDDVSFSQASVSSLLDFSLKGLAKLPGMEQFGSAAGIINSGASALQDGLSWHEEVKISSFMEISGIDGVGMLSGATNDKEAMGLTSMFTGLALGYNEKKHGSKQDYAKNVLIPKFHDFKDALLKTNE